MKLDLLKHLGTLYLPGKADVSRLCFSWDDPAVTVKADDEVYESGTAPVPAAGESRTYQIVCSIIDKIRVENDLKQLSRFK